MSEDYNKEDLEKQMHDKNVEMLKSEGGIESLLIFNLENFAYRYLETSTDKGIKAQVDGNIIKVESFEGDILEALKWDNPTLKKELISLCKEYPGQKSKELKVYLSIGSRIVSDSKVECFSEINWNYPSFDKSKKCITKQVVIEFDDPIILRNTHAKYLEEVCEIF